MRVRELREEREGAAGEFGAVDVCAHGLQHAGEVGGPYGAVVAAPGLGHADAARFWGARVVPDEAEAVIGVFEEGFRGGLWGGTGKGGGEGAGEEGRGVEQGWRGCV